MLGKIKTCKMPPTLTLAVKKDGKRSSRTALLNFHPAEIPRLEGQDREETMMYRGTDAVNQIIDNKWFNSFLVR